MAKTTDIKVSESKKKKEVQEVKVVEETKTSKTPETPLTAQSSTEKMMDKLEKTLAKLEKSIETQNKIFTTGFGKPTREKKTNSGTTDRTKRLRELLANRSSSWARRSFWDTTEYGGQKRNLYDRMDRSQAFSHGSLTSLIMSAMTGGVLNPVIISALGLDKAGRSLAGKLLSPKKKTEDETKGTTAAATTQDTQQDAVSTGKIITKNTDTTNLAKPTVTLNDVLAPEAGEDDEGLAGAQGRSSRATKAEGKDEAVVLLENIDKKIGDLNENLEASSGEGEKEDDGEGIIGKIFGLFRTGFSTAWSWLKGLLPTALIGLFKGLVPKLLSGLGGLIPRLIPAIAKGGMIYTAAKTVWESGKTLLSFAKDGVGPTLQKYKEILQDPEQAEKLTGIQKGVMTVAVKAGEIGEKVGDWFYEHFGKSENPADSEAFKNAQAEMVRKKEEREKAQREKELAIYSQKSYKPDDDQPGVTKNYTPMPDEPYQTETTSQKYIRLYAEPKAPYQMSYPMSMQPGEAKAPISPAENDVPLNPSINRNKSFPPEIMDNLGKTRSLVINPLKDALDADFGSGSTQLTITSSYRDPQYNREVGGARNSRHLTGKAIDLQASNMKPNELIQVMQKHGIPFTRAIAERSGSTEWLHVEYDEEAKGASRVATMVNGKYSEQSAPQKVATNSLSSPEENTNEQISTMTTLAALTRYDNASKSMDNASGGSYSSNNTLGSALASGMTNMPLSIPSGGGKPDNLDGGVYPVGDIAQVLLYA